MRVAATVTSSGRCIMEAPDAGDRGGGQMTLRDFGLGCDGMAGRGMVRGARAESEARGQQATLGKRNRQERERERDRVVQRFCIA